MTIFTKLLLQYLRVYGVKLYWHGVLTEMGIEVAGMVNVVLVWLSLVISIV